jgi:phospholipid/cholesterol/gamma-HCH transport system permease protein
VRILRLISGALGGFAAFTAAVARATVSNPLPVDRSLHEAYAIGVRSLPILLIISVFVGTNLTVQGRNAFADLGGQSLVGMFVALAGVREMAPIMVASMVAAKAGTEMASQIAVMRTQEQIDALQVMAIDPYWFLVTPRLLGIVVVLPALTMISILALMLAGLGVGVVQLGLDPVEFVAQAREATEPIHLVYCAVKAVFFGVIICLVSCYCGFASSPGPSGVGRATNAAVVVSAVLCALLNYVLSTVMFGR